MSNYRKFMILCSLPIWFISAFMLILGIKYLMTKKYIKFYDIEKPKFTKCFGISLIIFAFLLSYPITLDTILLDVKCKVVTVTGFNNELKLSVIKSELRTSNGIFNNMFNLLKFVKGSTYEIKYVPRSKVLLYGKKVID